MKIRIVTPAPPGSRQGNRVTALRWARLLRQLGHTVRVEQDYVRGDCDLLIALHARKSYPAIERFRRRHPHRPLLVGLAGTDLYQNMGEDGRGWRALEWATRILVLQPLAREALPPHLRGKVRVLFQSAQVPRARGGSDPAAFDICVLGHLREVKDPFRAALAARLLPPDSRVRVLHVGEALDEGLARRAREEEATNPRYRWLGSRSRAEALRILSACRLLALTSRSEGGANVVSEALAAGVPILSTAIPGSIGILGADYPGLFPVGDTEALAALMRRAEVDPAFYETLRRRCEALRPLVDPARERESWRRLLEELEFPQPEAAAVVQTAGTRGCLERSAGHAHGSG